MAITSEARYAPTASAKSKEKKRAKREEEEKESPGGGEEGGEREGGGGSGGPGRTGVRSLAWNTVSLDERKWVGRREKVVLGKEMEKSVVTVVVDTKVDQKLVVR